MRYWLTTILLLFSGAVALSAFDAAPMLMVMEEEEAGIEGFRVTFLTGTTPSNISLHADYGGPATSSAALFDSGDGNWIAYTGKTIAVVGDYVAFKGDWRDTAGGYESMFESTFTGPGYTCKFEGMLEETPSSFGRCYASLFRECTAVTAIEDNPIPILSGSPGPSMFSATCYNMTGVTSALPDGFLDTSGLTGTPAASMFNRSCYYMRNATGSLPEGFMDTRGLTGTPTDYMFFHACNRMNKVTGPLPDGFLDTTGLSGAPGEWMYRFSCFGMDNIAGGNINISTNITLTTTNLDSKGWLTETFHSCNTWTGQMYYGTSPIHTVITPANDLNTFRDCTNMPGYDTLNANWK